MKAVLEAHLIDSRVREAYEVVEIYALHSQDNTKAGERTEKSMMSVRESEPYSRKMRRGMRGRCIEAKALFKHELFL